MWWEKEGVMLLFWGALIVVGRVVRWEGGKGEKVVNWWGGKVEKVGKWWSGKVGGFWFCPRVGDAGWVRDLVISSTTHLPVGLCSLVCVCEWYMDDEGNGGWDFSLVADATLGNCCLEWEENCFAQLQGGGYRFVFRKLKLVCKCWQWGSALELKTQPWWVTIPGL